MSGTRGDTLTLTPELVGALTTLRRLPPYERAHAARRLVEELRGALPALRELEKAALTEMRDAGLSWHEIADLVDMPFTSVHNAVAGRKSRRKVTPSPAAGPAAAAPS